MIFKYIKNKYREVKYGYKIPDEDKNTVFERTDTKIGLIANYTIIFFIFVSIFIVFLSSIPGYNEKYLMYFFIADLIISTTFLIEYFYRWKNSSDKTKFPFKLMNILDLLSFLPFFILIFIYWIWTYSIFVIFRIFRIFRIFELIERIPIISKIINWISKHKVEYLSAIVTILIILIISSTLVFLVEKEYWNRESFISIPQTLWWAVVTMTTTWYWDMVPMSVIWKFIAWFLMLLWPVIIAIVSSITVVIFLDSTNIIHINKSTNTCKKCFTENPENAIFCNNCWKKLKK